MKFLHIFCLLLLFCSAQAQCPDNNIVFHNQAMIDSFPIKFPNCKNLGPIGFSIRESEQGNITSLLPFQQLIGTQECELFIIANKKLTSLAGLDNIDSIKNGVLIQNNSIKDINALTKLKYCKWGLTIEEDSLVNLSGLENLNYAFQVSLQSKNTGKISLKPLSGLREASNLIFSGNYIFEKLRLKYVKNLTIRSNDFIENLNGIFIDSLVENLTLFLRRDFSFEGQNRPSLINNISINGDKIHKLSFKGIESYNRIKNVYLFDFDSFANEASLESVVITNGLHVENIKNYPKNFLSSFLYPDSINLIGLVSLDSLINLKGLENVKELSGLRLSDNVNLKNIDALLNVKSANVFAHVYIPNKQYYLMIDKNPMLNYCQIPFICDILNKAPSSKVFINQNDELCEDKDAVIKLCKVTMVTETEKGEKGGIYPNPIKPGNQIFTHSSERIVQWSIFDLTGNQIISSFQEPITIPNTIKPGVYILKTKTSKNSASFKLWIY